MSKPEGDYPKAHRLRWSDTVIEFRKYRQEESGKRGGPTNRRDWVLPEERPTS